MVLVGVFKMKGSWVQSVKKIDTVVSDDVLFALEDDLSSRVLLNEPPGYSPSIQQQQQQTATTKNVGNTQEPISGSILMRLSLVQQHLFSLSFARS